jgi:hypothetical protein
MQTSLLTREDAACDTRSKAGLTPVTEFDAKTSERARLGLELRAIAARIGLDSDQKIADRIEMNRGMVSRVL